MDYDLDYDFDLNEFFPKLPDHIWATESKALQKVDIRPRFLEGQTKNWVLVDSGAMVTVVPRSLYPNALPDTTTRLKAVNGSQVDTFGKTTITLQMGRK